MPGELHPTRVAEFYCEEPGQLQRAATDAAADYVARRTVAVGLFDPNYERGIRRGTGTCVSIRGTYLVATAAHHFVDVPEEPFEVGVLALSNIPNRSIFRARRFNFRGGRAGDREDVAWLELSEATAHDLGREFLTLDGILPYYSGVPGEPLFSYGFPDHMEITPKEDGQAEFGFAVQSYATFVLPTKGIAPRFHPNPDFDIFARYSTRELVGTLPKGRVAKLPDAPGLSGGGFWRVNIGKRGIWTPDDVKLVGIEHEWWPDDEWFRATKVCHWLRLVADDHPATRREIEAALALGRQ